jgi:mycofactocin biosynthesis protein MftB
MPAGQLTGPARAVSFDLDAHWRLHPQVALRPEPFGALAYHFGTRRLSFLKSRTLLDVVQGMSEHGTALEACQAAGLAEHELDQYQRALATLADSGMIVREAPEMTSTGR